jgi:hypothetical protein
MEGVGVADGTIGVVLSGAKNPFEMGNPWNWLSKRGNC